MSKNNFLLKNGAFSNEELDNLRLNILKKLSQLNIKLPKLSELMGIPYQSLWRMMYDGYQPNISSLYPIANFFNVSLADLLKHPDLPQYVPILEFEQIEPYFDSKINIEQIEKVLSNEFIHEQAFAIRIKGNTHSINFDSIYIIKPYNKVINGILLIKYQNKINLVLVSKINKNTAEIIIFPQETLTTIKLNDFTVLGIAVKQYVNNDLT